jgi:hypothetical protein
MNLTAFKSEIANIPHTDDPAVMRRKSRDMTNSPLLKAEAEGKLADIFVSPQSKAEVMQVARACARHRVPVMVRGAGTANFGQGIPLAGGAVIDMTSLNKILWVKDRKVRTEPGILMIDLDNELQRDHGLEIRMHPSTRRRATIGGFVAGGHVGIGSCTYGILRDRGNIVGIEAVSVEENPRLVEVRGNDVNQIHHAYGTNGIITELELPLAPAWRWLEAIVEFDVFMKMIHFLIELCESRGLVVKLASAKGAPLPDYIEPLAPYVAKGRHCAHVMVADEYRDVFHAMVQEFGGKVTYEGLEGQGPFKLPLYEFSFGHVFWYVNKYDATLTSNVGIFPSDDLAGSIERVHRRYAGAPFHLEMKRIDGRLTGQGSPLFPYVDADNLARKIEELQSLGVQSANNHTYLLREGGMKHIAAAEIAFKRAMDPHNLMNPGKFLSEEKEEKGVGDKLPTSGWKFRQPLETAAT